jgi:hypothetical protein
MCAQSTHSLYCFFLEVIVASRGLASLLSEGRSHIVAGCLGGCMSTAVRAGSSSRSGLLHVQGSFSTILRQPISSRCPLPPLPFKLRARVTLGRASIHAGIFFARRFILSDEQGRCLTSRQRDNRHAVLRATHGSIRLSTALDH